MKRVISLVIAAIMISSSVAPTFAQKRQAATSKGNKQSVSAESTRFSSFSAYTDGQGVWLAWQMQVEVGNIGFNVYRVGKEGVELLTPVKFVSGGAFRGSETPTYGESYGFFDRDGTGDARYYLEAFTLQGTKIQTPQIYPQYTISLESLTGLSTDQLASRGESEPGTLESSRLTYTKEIVNEMEESSAAPDLPTHRTVISTPGAVRIGVKGDGIVRVSRTQLENAGFNVNADPSLWQLYMEGNEQAIIIGENASYIEFLGKGLDAIETDIRRYYLINGTTPGKRIESRVATRNTSTVVTPNYLQTFVKRERINWVDDIINGDADNYFGRGFGATPTVLNFNLSGVDFSLPNSTLYLTFQGYSLTAHTVNVKLNDVVLAPTTSTDPGEVQFSSTYSINTSALREGANTIEFVSAATAADFNFFDTMSIDFSRKYLADQNKLAFYTQNYRAAKLEGFASANVRVFDVTREGSPVLLTNLDFQANGPTFGTTMPAARGRSFYAVENSAILAPESVTPNNPELLDLPTNGADLVIIAYKDLMAEAQTWANYRISQGISVKLVQVDDIYDEFNYGSLGWLSVRTFLQRSQSWANAPEYVLLIGDASWDSRNYEGLGNFNFIPPRIVSTREVDTASDEALADFDGDGLAEMAIGRISARTPAQVTTVYNKVVAWEAQTGDPFQRGAVFAHDNNNGYPFLQMSNTLRNMIPSIPNATMVARNPTPQGGGLPTVGMGNLITALNTGPYIVNYSGHGSPGTWNVDFFASGTINHALMTDHSPGVYTMLTCLNGYYHWLYNPSLAEILTHRQGRGAVAAWASSGKTTPDLQEVMANRFYSKLNEGNIPRLGDLIRDAKSTLVIFGIDVRLSWALIGDPMLKMRFPAPAK